MSRFRAPTTFCWLLIFMLSPIFLLPSGGCDEIVLRNLKKISEVTVEQFDEDGIVLTGGQSYGLDAIYSAKLKQQSEFDELHKRFAEDLFRIRLRTRNGDFENLQPHLEKVFPIYTDRQSQTAVLVHLAKLRESVLQGNWATAIVSHFKLYTLASLDQRHQNFLQTLGYKFEAKTGYSSLICPFEYSEQELVENWNSILAAYKALPAKHPSGLDFYFFTMCEASAMEIDPQLATKRLQLTSLEKSILETISKATSEKVAVAEIESARVALDGYQFQESDSVIQRALYHFVYGLLEIRSESADSNEGLLSLLRIHAEYGDKIPSMSAAALNKVHGVLEPKEPKKNAKNVANELLSRYPSSIFAKQLRMRGDRVK